MSNEQKVKVFNTVAMVCNVTEGMMSIFITMPENMVEEKVAALYDMSIRDLAKLWQTAAKFPEEDNQFDFPNLLNK